MREGQYGCWVSLGVRSNLPQTTLTLPPEGKLRDRLADSAVQDCQTRLSVVNSSRSEMNLDPIHTLRIAKARPSIDLEKTSRWSALRCGSGTSEPDIHTAKRIAASAQPCGPSEPTGYHRQGIFRPWWAGVCSADVIAVQVEKEKRTI